MVQLINFSLNAQKCVKTRSKKERDLEETKENFNLMAPTLPNNMDDMFKATIDINSIQQREEAFSLKMISDDKSLLKVAKEHGKDQFFVKWKDG